MTKKPYIQGPQQQHKNTQEVEPAWHKLIMLQGHSVRDVWDKYASPGPHIEA